MLTNPITFLTQPAGGEWSPADLASLYAWWDFSDEGTVDAPANRVNSITDKSGNGYTLSKIPANGPGYRDLSVTQNGLNTAAFDGADRRLATAGNHSFGDFTLVVVYRFTGNDQAARIADHQYQNGWWLGRRPASATGDGGGIRESSSPFGHYLTQEIGTWRIIAFGRNGTSKRVYGNDGATVTATVSSTATASNIVALGGDVGTDAAHMRGNIGEVVLCNTWLGTSDFNQVGQYLADKWGLSWTDL